MSTKKQAKAADLPTKNKSTYVRPSRSKAAIAERDAAFLETVRQVNEASPLTDNDFPLEQETAAAVADLDIDPETVRSLAEIDLGDDPFVEEAATDRLRRAQAVKLELENAERQPGNSVVIPDRVRELEAECERLTKEVELGKELIAKLDRAELSTNIRKFREPAILITPLSPAPFNKHLEYGFGAVSLEIVDRLAPDFQKPDKQSPGVLVNLYRGRGNYYAPILAGEDRKQLALALGETVVTSLANDNAKLKGDLAIASRKIASLQQEVAIRVKANGEITQEIFRLNETVRRLKLPGFFARLFRKGSRA